MKNKFNKKVIVILLFCMILTIIRLIMDYKYPMFLQPEAIYDDGLLYNYSLDLGHFNWLGDFGQLTLAKPAGYSLFMCASYFFRIPLSTFTMLYYILSISMLALALKKMIKNNVFVVFLYIALLFCPITFEIGAFKVMYRNAVQIATSLIVIASAINVFYLRNNKKKFFVSLVMLSLSLSFFYFVKEDAIWIFPFVIGALVITAIYIIIDNNRKFNKRLLFLVLPFLLLFITTTFYKYMNYNKYGEYTITDRTGTNFHLVINDIMSIKSKHTKNAWVTKEAIYKAIDASRSLQKYKDTFDELLYKDWGLTDDGELHGDLFYWRIRFCLDNAGLYNKTGKEVNEYYGKVHRELLKAFEKGILERDNKVYHISSSLPNYNKSEFEEMKNYALPMTKKILDYDLSSEGIKIIESLGSEESINKAQRLTKSVIYKNGDTKYDNNLKLQIKIVNIYKKFGFVLGIIGIIGNLFFYIKTIDDIRKKKYENISQLLIQIGLTLTYILYFIIILWFGYKFTNRDLIIYGYMHPAHIILNILTIIGLYNLISILFNKLMGGSIKMKKNLEKNEIKKDYIKEKINDKKIAVLIPCYNESKTIEKVVKDYKKVLPEADIYVYDNNSNDNTDKIAKKAGAIVRYEYKQGKGNVIRSMFRQIDADCYLMIDGDDTYPSENAREMCDLILEGKADMVIGDRLSSTYFTENKRPFHNFGNKIVRLLINKIFKNNVKDIMTGYRAFSYEFVKGFPILSKGFEIETEMTIHAVDKNYNLVEIPVTYRDRPEGSISKLNTYSDGLKVLKTIATLFKEYKPTFFFNIFSVILLIISLIFAIPVVSEYFKTGLVPRFPTLIVSCIILLISILLWITGIILQVIVKKHKQLYEILMNQIKK